MCKFKCSILFIPVILFVLNPYALTKDTGGQPPKSEWVYPGPDGKLIYKTTPAGDKIMDFSCAGYMGGGVALPDVPVKQTIQPSGEDDTALIQAAVDAVSDLPVQNGFRGAVLLEPGVYTCSGSIVISSNGVVLRGSGNGLDGKPASTIKMVGEKHSAIDIALLRGQRNQNDSPDFDPAKTIITDEYVPSGATKVHVQDATGFSAGDFIAIRKPITDAWTHFMEMDDLVRDGKPQTWLSTNRNNSYECKIIAVSGNAITVDIPLSDSFDANYLNPPGCTVTQIRPGKTIDHVGVEYLHIQCPALEIMYGNAPYSAIRINGEDCWVKDVYCEETMNSTVLRGKRITMEGVVVKHTNPNLGASKPTDFSIEGSQMLIDRCEVTGGNTYFVWTGSLIHGPNVVLNCRFSGYGNRVQPHHRWATGLLVDNCRILDGGIDFMNRGVMGSGHGWAMGWGVAWNCNAKTYIIQQPPGACNWAIGCIGERIPTPRPFDSGPDLPEGIFDSYGHPVVPQSLYLTQLIERLGPKAIEQIGYSLDNPSQFMEDFIFKSEPFQVQVDPEFGPDLAEHRPVNPSNVRNQDRTYGAENVLDADPKTYWMTDDSVTEASIIVDLEGAVEINAAEIQEAMELGPRVQAYKIEGQINSDWKLLAEGSTIGERQVHRFPTENPWKVRLTILKATDSPAIRRFSFYKTKE